MKRGHRAHKIAEKLNKSVQKSTTGENTRDINEILLSSMHPDRRRSSITDNCSNKTEVLPNTPITSSTPLISPLTPLMLKREIYENVEKETASPSPPPYSPLTPLMIKKRKTYGNAEKSTASPSPPPYSPLTPLMIKKRKAYKNVEKSTATPSPPSYSPLTPLMTKKRKTCRNSENNRLRLRPASPIPQMSPETQLLYDTLCEPTKDILNLSEVDSLNLTLDDIFEDNDDFIKDSDNFIENSEQEDDTDSLIENSEQEEDGVSQIGNSEQEGDHETEIENSEQEEESESLIENSEHEEESESLIENMEQEEESESLIENSGQEEESESLIENSGQEEESESQIENSKQEEYSETRIKNKSNTQFTINVGSETVTSLIRRDGKNTDATSSITEDTEQELDMTQVTDKDQEIDTMPTKEKEQEMRTLSKKDKKQDIDTTPTKDKKQLPRIENEQKTDNTPTIDKEQEIDNTSAIDKEQEIDNTSAINKEQEVDNTSAIDKEQEVDNTSPINKEQEIDNTSAIDKEQEIDNTPTVEQEQEIDDTSAIDKEQEVDNMSPINKEQEIDNTPAIDKEQEIDNTFAIDKEQEIDNRPTVEQEQEIDNTSAIDKEQEIDNTSAIDKEQEIDNTPTVEQEQNIDNTPTVEQEQEIDNTSAIDKGQEVDNTSAINKEQEIDNTSTVEQEHEIDNTSAIDKGQEVDNTSPINKEQEIDNTSSIDKGQEVDYTSAINKEQEIDNTSAIDKEQEIDNTPTVEQEQNIDNTPTVEQEQEIDNTSAIDKGHEVDNTSAINKEQEIDNTSAIDKEQEIDNTPTVEQEQNIDNTPTVEQEQEIDNTSAIDKGQEVDSTSAINKEQEVDNTPTVEQEQEKDNTPIIDNERQIDNTPTIDIEQAERPKKGRKRKNDEYTLQERKKRKYSNMPYQSKNKLVPAKVFNDCACQCSNECFLKISRETRKTEFDKYVSLGTYESQLLYITNCVKETKKKRTYTCTNTKTGKKKPREYSRTYTIGNINVCREMFVKTLQITPQKINFSLKKNRNALSLQDRRGKAAGGWNRTPLEDIDFACKIINSLPKYESHYRRAQNGGALYLRPGMNFRMLYDFYVKEHTQEYNGLKKCLSLGMFKKIFNTKFNLKFKNLRKDTCNKCDTIAAKLLRPDLTNETKESLLSEKETHLGTAESLRDQLNKDMDKAKTDSSFECITFDMEKTLPLPKIPTNIIFYKRQLWFYNCGIHVGSSSKGHCYVWLEGEAGRGAQEVGSCLVKYISSNLKPNTKHLTLWSDSCGGQNRNIKVVLLLKVYLAEHPSLETITLKFLESGHSFLPNDTDFGKIESHLKHFERIYTAQDYISVIKTCTRKTPLEVVKMNKDDFLGTKLLEKNIVNRKIFNDKQKVNWLKTKQILLKKENIYSIYMRQSAAEEFRELSIEKKFKGKTFSLNKEQLVPLWPNGKEIAKAKLDDLKSIFHLIPHDCLQFYKNLTGSESVIDDVDGYGNVDFDMDE